MMVTVAALLGGVLLVGVGMLGALDPLPLHPEDARTRNPMASDGNRMTAFRLRKRNAGPSAGPLSGEVRQPAPPIYRSRIDLHFFDRA